MNYKYEFLGRIEEMCFILYPQFNKKEYSNLPLDQKRTGYKHVVKEMLKILSLKEISDHSPQIDKLIEKYKMKIVGEN